MGKKILNPKHEILNKYKTLNSKPVYNFGFSACLVFRILFLHYPTNNIFLIFIHYISKKH